MGFCLSFVSVIRTSREVEKFREHKEETFPEAMEDHSTGKNVLIYVGFWPECRVVASGKVNT